MSNAGRTPRNVTGQQLIRALQRLGYVFVRQQGSHMRLRPPTPGKPVTVPNHNPIRVGTLEFILSDLAAHLGVDRDELLRRLNL